MGRPEAQKELMTVSGLGVVETMPGAVSMALHAGAVYRVRRLTCLAYEQVVRLVALEMKPEAMEWAMVCEMVLAKVLVALEPVEAQQARVAHWKTPPPQREAVAHPHQ